MSAATDTDAVTADAGSPDTSARHQARRGASSRPVRRSYALERLAARFEHRPQRRTQNRGTTMKLLIACEKSGRVRDAFRARGHDAVSCDLLPSDAPGPHIICDHTLHLADIAYDRRRRWDGLITFPPCTFINGAGLHWNNRGRGQHRTEEALEFVCMLLNAPVDKISLENPVGCISTRYTLGSRGLVPDASPRPNVAVLEAAA